jgi:hypothetical protein
MPPSRPRAPRDRDAAAPGRFVPVPESAERESWCCPCEIMLCGCRRLLRAPQRRAPTGTVSLRACLKRSRSGSETPHHQLDHGDPDPRLCGCGQGLEVFTQPPRAIEPAECAFDDPAPLQDLKPWGVPGAFHDHQSPLQHRRHPRNQLASIPSIGPDQLQSREAGDQCRQNLFGPVAVLHPSRMDDDDEEQPQDIDHDVALATAEALASVIAPDPPFSVVFTV